MAEQVSTTPIITAILHRLHALATSFILYLLALGPIPQHVGFVMDGNRRYARRRGKQVAEGHRDGLTSLRRTLQVCLKLRIRAVTIYAFSIDNFSRSAEEVAELMELARVRLLELCQKGDILERHGIRVRFVGRREMLPEQVLKTFEDIERLTAGNTNGVLNVASPYTSRDEITTAVRDTVSGSEKGQMEERDVNPMGMFNSLETSQNVSALLRRRPDPAMELEGGKLDILVRTSNVKRLSDFMMWQAADDTQLHFVRTMWPEFGLSDMLPILLGWQQKMWLRSLGW